jgi:hypothetical protein
MKLFVKILLFVSVALVTNVKVTSAAITFSNIQEVTTSLSFQNETPKTIYKVIKNDEANCCKNGNDLVDYGNRGKGIEAVAAKTESRIQAGSLKDFKTLVNQLSKPSSKVTQAELNELRTLAQKYGGTVRVDLTGIKGTGVNPHVHIEGLGKSVESRHIWLNSGIK